MVKYEIGADGIKFPEILTPEMILSLADRPDGFIEIIKGEKGKRLLVVYQNGTPVILKLSKWDNAKMWAKRILGLKSI